MLPADQPGIDLSMSRRDRVGVSASITFPLPTLQRLKAATTRSELAFMLGFQPKMLTSILYLTPDASKYTIFEVPKKAGGMREIAAPIPKLKNLQRCLSDLLYGCLSERMAESPYRFTSQYGYLKERSVEDNAERHRSQRFVLNVDIADFFRSINFGRVRGFFIADKGFELHPQVATTIAQIACWNNELPQGSPCSPIISSLIGGILDRRMAVLARENSCTYTRYVDDLTFSTNATAFPEALARFAGGSEGWVAGAALTHAVAKAGFSLNPAKTRLFSRRGRQTVTGLVVNRKVNVNQDYEMRVRAAFHRWCRQGSYTVPGSIEKVAAGEEPELETGIDRLEGMLQWIFRVRDFADLRQQIKKRHNPSSFRKTYRDFLFAKNFLFMDRPLIICEGKTDNIYLDAAMKSLAADFPRLAIWQGEEFKRLVRLFTYTHKTQEVMHLGGGFGDLVQVARDYRRSWAKLAKRAVTYPVIMVVDNDDGGKEVFKAVRDVGGPEIAIADPTILFHAFHNLYLIKTPHIGAKVKTCVEDLFDAATLALPLGQKTFDPKVEAETDRFFGKKIFAEGIVRPSWKNIPFDGFRPMLAAIEEAIFRHG
jgi:RNA-directed DNA polymerase